ncbi:cell wall hydrolase [Brevundimonas balnearis]|uniref:Cell wall hydrolase n=1 Tax=Brevundimonas balnearis TaxID=1572858 RepID=A0ABV6R055_9CAUL
MKRLAIMTRSGARRLFAAAPAAGAALGVALAASSAPRPESDRTAEAVARVTGGDLGEAGLARLKARLDPSQAALAARFDPAGGPQAQRLGLTPGWESLSMNGKPVPNPGPAGLEARRINASVAADAAALRPARPFVFTPRTAEDRRRALRCLTQAIYYEAALESTDGQEAVAQVILNRVRDPNYANTVCGVVFEGAERTTGCQFSFTCDGSLSQPPVAWAWNRAAVVAERALAGHVAAEVGTATHYHADYVNPWWRPSLTKINQIGTHIFYRWKGWAGETRAFSQRYAGVEPRIDEARFSRPRLLRASAEAPAAVAPQPGLAGQLRTVEVEGQTRVVGAASLGGRRPPTPEEIAAINRSLADFEAPRQPAAPAPAGVPVLEVEEVGRPTAR